MKAQENIEVYYEIDYYPDISIYFEFENNLISKKGKTEIDCIMKNFQKMNPSIYVSEGTDFEGDYFFMLDFGTLAFDQIMLEALVDNIRNNKLLSEILVEIQIR